MKFNIVNFVKRESLFSQGMRVSIFSKKRNDRYRTGWFKGGTNLKYGLSKLSKAGAMMYASHRG